MENVYREITPLSPYDCFTVFSRNKTEFDFPLHTHEEYELNFIQNAKGAQRIIGYHVGEIEDLELVLVNGNLPHAWYTHNCKSDTIYEITIQFHKDLFDEKFLQRNQLSNIRSLLQRSAQGILFSPETISAYMPKLELLTKKRGFDSMIEFMSLLHDLSVSRNMQVLSNASNSAVKFDHKSKRIEKAFEYMQINFDKEITLKDVAESVNMPEVSFSRFIKKRTGKTFIDSLNDIRLGHVSRLLIDTSDTVAEISYRCGFNNLSYFNRMFKKKNGCTPKEFRDNYTGSKLFI